MNSSLIAAAYIPACRIEKADILKTTLHSPRKVQPVQETGAQTVKLHDGMGWFSRDNDKQDISTDISEDYTATATVTVHGS